MSFQDNIPSPFSVLWTPVAKIKVCATGALEPALRQGQSNLRQEAFRERLYQEKVPASAPTSAASKHIRTSAGIPGDNSDTLHGRVRVSEKIACTARSLTVTPAVPSDRIRYSVRSAKCGGMLWQLGRDRSGACS